MATNVTAYGPKGSAAVAGQEILFMPEASATGYEIRPRKTV